MSLGLPRKLLLVMLSLTCNATQARANAPFSQSGSIAPTYMSDLTKDGFRVAIAPGLIQCSGSFAYARATDVGFAAFIALTATAYRTRKPVQLVMEFDSQGYCHLLQMSLS